MKVPGVELTTTVTEQKNTPTSLGMVNPEITAVNPNTQNIFYTCSTRPHTGDDKIEVLLPLYTAKLDVMRDDASSFTKFEGFSFPISR